MLSCCRSRGGGVPHVLFSEMTSSLSSDEIELQLWRCDSVVQALCGVTAAAAAAAAAAVTQCAIY